MIIQNSKGHIFLDFFNVKEKKISNEEYQPLTHSLLVVKYNNSFLLVFDKWKNNWELPGGSIENNESPRDCAIRELKEETNQEISDLKFKGIMKFQLQPDNRIEYGALYIGKLKNFIEFDENDEIKEIKLWNQIEPIDIDEIDKKLLDYY